MQKELLKNTTSPVSNDLELTALRDLEASVIINTIRHFGERKKAAEALGISHSTLYQRLKNYGLEDKF